MTFLALCQYAEWMCSNLFSVHYLLVYSALWFLPALSLVPSCPLSFCLSFSPDEALNARALPPSLLPWFWVGVVVVVQLEGVWGGWVGVVLGAGSLNPSLKWEIN